MRSYFKSLVERLPLVASDVEARVLVVSGVRHLLQMVNYGLVEWIAARVPDPDMQPPPQVLADLHAPSDGALVEALEALLISAEQNGWTGAYRPLFREVAECDGCLPLCEGHSTDLAGLLRALVALRNDGGEGHGLPGQYRRKEEEASLKFVLEALDELIPRIEGEVVEVGPHGYGVTVRMLRAFSGKPVLVRKIKQVNSSTVRIQGKYYNEVGVLESISYDAWNPFSRFVGQSAPGLIEFVNSWGPMCYLPERVTDTFVGRDKEREAIVEWLDDVEQRACLVFGDGGVGKTTLVIETLHQVLEEEIRLGWKPRVVCFYTAKKLQFGLEGLAPVGVGRPHLMDLLSHLHVLLTGAYPGKEFYRLGVVGAATRLQDLMRESLGLDRKDHLIVVDNAETLIESDEDRDVLGKELKEIARRIGRILITSRRREILGADPVELGELPKVDAVRFLRKRGEGKLEIPAIRRAKDGELLAVVEDLECRPIVLDAFLNALTDPLFNTLQKAKKKVLGLLQKDLGIFLFSDAWNRLSKETRTLMLLMTRVADVHDFQSFRICCDVAQVDPQGAEKAFEESGGIASVVRIGSGVQISFSKNFLDFCKGREGVSQDQIDQARHRYSQFVARARSFSGDRVLEAFRIPVAKAAHRAASEGDLEEARLLYEQATLSDSANGLLFDRYAFFLFSKLHHNDAALHQAKRATGLLPNNGEVWFTRGMIEGRLGDARAAESSLEKAEAFGVSRMRCSLQRAWAYLKCRPRPQIALAQRELRFLETAISALPLNSRDRFEVGNIRSRFDYLKRRFPIEPGS